MEISIQTSRLTRNFGLEEGYRMIREAGFTAIDWNIDGWVTRENLLRDPLDRLCIFQGPLEGCLAHYEAELAIIRKNGLKITQAHAPFPAYVRERPESLDYMIEIYRQMIRFCHRVGCGNLVIHGINLAQFDYVNTPDTIRALNQKLFESLIDALQQTNVTVCMETLYTGGGTMEGNCSNPYDAVSFIDSLNEKAGREAFGLCMDTGHINLTANSFRLYVPILGKRIKALHIHDNSGAADSHMMPYSGTVRWHDFCDTLREIGYSGDLSFETFRQTDQGFLPPELVPVFLHTMAETGKYFRQRIQG